MKIVLTSIALIAIMLWIHSCNKELEQGPVFADAPAVHPITGGVINEASGIADSYINPGYLWVNEDSQQPTQLFLLAHNGQVSKKIYIKNISNRDWEEVALANGPDAGKKFLYIAETGDNDHLYPDYFFYRFAEPVATTDTVFQVDKIRFKYPDGSHDSEAFFVEPSSKDIYIITKRETQSKIYKLSYPQSTTALNTAVFVADLPYNGVVAATYSESKKELLIKTYSSIYYYRHSGQAVAELVKESSMSLPYQVEPQGEAVCFANDGSGFFTLSEKGIAPFVNLNFYQRK